MRFDSCMRPMVSGSKSSLLMNASGGDSRASAGVPALMCKSKLFELCGQSVRASRQHDKIAADSDEEITYVDAAFTLGFAHEYPRGFAGIADALGRFSHHFP